MTREEAIDILNHVSCFTEDEERAIALAISVLKRNCELCDALYERVADECR